MALKDEQLQQNHDNVMNVLTGIFRQLEKVSQQLTRLNDLKEKRGL